MEFIEKYVKVDDDDNSDDEMDEVRNSSNDEFIDDSVQDPDVDDPSNFRLTNFI